MPYFPDGGKLHFCYLQDRRFYQMEAHVFKNFFLRWDFTFPLKKGIKLPITTRDWHVLVARFSKKNRYKYYISYYFFRCFVRFFVRFFCPIFLCDLFVWLFLCDLFSDVLPDFFCPIFSVIFFPIFCLICFVRFFGRIFLSDILFDFLSDCPTKKMDIQIYGTKNWTKLTTRHSNRTGTKSDKTIGQKNWKKTIKQKYRTKYWTRNRAKTSLRNFEQIGRRKIGRKFGWQCRTKKRTKNLT